MPLTVVVWLSTSLDSSHSNTESLWGVLCFGAVYHAAQGGSSLRMRGGLLVSAFDFRSGGRWFKPSLCHRVVSLDKKLYSTLPLLTQMYKRVPAIMHNAGV